MILSWKLVSALKVSKSLKIKNRMHYLRFISLHTCGFLCIFDGTFCQHKYTASEWLLVPYYNSCIICTVKVFSADFIIGNCRCRTMVVNHLCCFGYIILSDLAVIIHKNVLVVSSGYYLALPKTVLILLYELFYVGDE